MAHSNALGTGNKTITGNSVAGVYALDGSSGDVILSSAISVNTTGAGLFNIAGNNTIAGVITLTGGAGGSTWQSNSGTLTVTNSITPNATARSLTLQGSGNFVLSGAIADGPTVQLPVTKTGSGTLTLSGSSTYSGITTISAGSTLKLGNANALGLGGSALGGEHTSIASGAVLDLNGTTGIPEVIRISGTGISSGGVLVNANTSMAASLSSSGGVVMLANSSIGGAGDFSIGSDISGGFDLTKIGAGTLTLTGSNSFTGVLRVSAGTVSLASMNDSGAVGALGNSSSAVSLGTLAGSTGTIQYTGTTASSTKLFTMATSGTGAFQIDSSATVLALSGVIDGSGRLNKTGVGSLALTGINTFTGALNVQGGTLVVLALNDASIAGAVGNSSTGVTLGNSGNSIGTIEYTGATATSNKPFILATGGSGAFQVDTSTANLTLSGVLSGAGNLIKTGPGLLTLNGSNTFTGSTSVTGGTLQITGSSAFAGGGSVNVASGAGFSYNAPTPAQLTIGGNFTFNGGAGSVLGTSVGSGTSASRILVAGSASTTGS